MKSTVDEIGQRFDVDVERLSYLETGQSATVDAPLAMALIAQAAAATTPQARRVLDVGCGAGNYTLQLLEQLSNLDVTLIDLSQPMLDQATQRVRQATAGRITTFPGRHSGNRASFRRVRHCAGCCGPSSPTGRRGVASGVRGGPPVTASGWLVVGVRSGRKLDP